MPITRASGYSTHLRLRETASAMKCVGSISGCGPPINSRIQGDSQVFDLLSPGNNASLEGEFGWVAVLPSSTTAYREEHGRAILHFAYQSCKVLRAVWGHWSITLALRNGFVAALNMLLRSAPLNRCGERQ
ncbi:hypothetical protein Trydic_g12983 [Trypoxylus dichotomus]